MSVESICNKIQDIVNGSTLIASAPHMESWPGSINAADLPMALTRPGSGTWPHDTITDIRSHRTYYTDVYVLPNAQGRYGDGVQQTLAVIQSLGDILSSNYQLDSSVFDSEPRDDGLLILTYGDGTYRGTRFAMEVIEDVADT